MFTAFSPRPSFLRPGFATAPPGVGAGGGPVVDSTIFLAGSQPSGLARAENIATINGLAGALSVAYLGADANGATWPAESGTGLGDLAIASSGTDPTSVLTPATTLAERAVRLLGGKVYQATSSATGVIGTEDVCIELVYRHPTTTFAPIIATRNSASGGVGAGWTIQALGVNQGRLLFGGGGQLSFVTGVAAGAWIVLHVFIDRNEASATTGCQIYVNGALSAQGDLSAQSAAFTNDGNVTIGSTASFATKADGVDVAAVRMWLRDAWFPGGATNTTQWAAWAKERCARIAGAYPEIATGTATPVTMTRSTVAHLDRIIDEATLERRLFPVAPNWPRFCRRVEAVGAELVSGFLLEAQATNLCLRSEEFDNASWTQANLTITANALAAPDGATTADTLDVTVGLGAASVQQAPTLTAASYVFSAWVKAGVRTRCWLGNATIANGIAWFDVSGGTVGTVQAGVTEALIEPFGNGWFRCSIRFTGTAAAHTLCIGVANTDGSTTTTTQAGALSIWGAQCELASACSNVPSSYIATTTASTTRTTDTLVYKGDDGNFAANAPGMFSAQILMPSADVTSWFYGIISAGPSSQSPDAIILGLDAATDAARVTVNVGAVNQYATSGTIDVSDGEIHTVATTWELNEGKLLVDGVQEGATDTSVALIAGAPAAISVLGQLLGTTPNALIGNVRIRNATT